MSPVHDDPLVSEILDVFAHEARIERSRLRLDACADELGVTSLDLALALFEIEARYGVTLAEPAPGLPPPTIGELVQQVLASRAQGTQDRPASAPAGAVLAGPAAAR
jgi:acyl carrier protein